MKKLYMLIALFGLISHVSLYAQSTANVDNVAISVKEDVIEITYDLNNAEPKETFTVWLKAYTPDGQEIKASLFSGDVGENIEGGMRKRVIWNAGLENLNLASYLYFDVFAKSSLTSKRQSVFKNPGFQRSAKSIALPGLGNSNKKRPYWIAGIAAYGLVAGSVILNGQASDDYSNYLSSRSVEDRNQLFSDAENKDQLSKTMAYSAGAIWLGGVIFALINKSSDNAGFSLDTNTQYPGLSLNFRF